jgi:hypothetical protein
LISLYQRENQAKTKRPPDVIGGPFCLLAVGV